MRRYVVKVEAALESSHLWTPPLASINREQRSRVKRATLEKKINYIFIHRSSRQTCLHVFVVERPTMLHRLVELTSYAVLSLRSAYPLFCMSVAGKLRRWVERGKEDATSATTELPPPPMTNHGLDKVASKRRTVAERYRLQENLRVSGTADGHLVTNSLFPQMGMLVPQLRHHQAEDDSLLHSGPPSASSECSSADSSSSPSARSSSSGLSLSNGAHAALEDSSTSSSTSSSANSSRAGSACGSTEDTASSPSQGADDDTDLHVFMALASPFSRTETEAASHQPYKIAPQLPSCGTKLLQLSQTLDAEGTKAAARGYCDDATASSVSILCTVDSAVLAAGQCQEQSIAGAARLEVSPSPQPSGGQAAAGWNSSCTLHNLENLPAALGRDGPVMLGSDAAADAVGFQDFGGLSVSEGGAVLSRSSSLALSFADLVHPGADSLPEPESVEKDPDLLVVLSKGERDRAAAHAGDRLESSHLGLGDVLPPLQDQQQHQLQQATRGQGQRQGRSDDVHDDDPSFSFAPFVFAKSLSSSTAASGVTDCANAVACRWASCSWGKGGSSDTPCVPGSLLPLECCSGGHTLVKAPAAPADAMAESHAAAQGFSAIAITNLAKQQEQQQQLQLNPDLATDIRHGSSLSPSLQKSDGNSIDRKGNRRDPKAPCGGSHSRVVVPQCGGVAASTAKGVVMDLTAVDSAVQLLKQLSGALLTARAKPGKHANATSASKVHKGSAGGSRASNDSNAVDCNAGAGPGGSQRCSPPAAGTLGASLAQAAEKLASLGLLPTPPSSVNAAASRPTTAPAVKAPCGDAELQPEASVAASGSLCSPAISAAGAAASVHRDVAAPLALAIPPYDCGADDVSPAVMSAGEVRTGQQQQPAVALYKGSPSRAAAGGGSRCKALLRQMRADWARVQEQVGSIMADYSALGKLVAAVVAKQVVLERRCSEVESGKAALARQLQRERQQRGAVEHELEQERAQRQLLAQRLEQEREQHSLLMVQLKREHREALEQQNLKHDRCCHAADREDWPSGVQQVEGEAECSAGALRVEMDELLLCLGQESTKVSLLAEALRAAGGDPEPLIEQVELDFVGRELVGG
ncbi:hypothetical protein VOLCADRAFT_93979 [Volvox carteri f. nagariensis]|uniref:Uncharacterized protein n=1 Tax=Volvox carteri f. nagariensis TaxID=3068 RepID=D8U3L0_VOLCA|nr:uncharacterized protein VOLCADRAFT_93979 [Volvox carteri f. nagariensis]EFJ45550.1 hypothetical protein VOLCADRAFT_93979 [Volvox carteri f. nagariensis]|eukprot:XP_002953240.1 hypothetical protein VOLCADRAFT_93979 [Volvox carteri f. nagariensis]